MICQRCLFRAARSSPLGASSSGAAATIPPRTLHRRQYALKANANTTPPPPNPAKPRGPGTETHEGHPAATSSSAAQPFSAREDPPGPPRSPKAQTMEPSGSVNEIESLPRVKSSAPAGQPLAGLGYFKDRDPPLALEDSEYPPWLWTLLDNGNKGNTSADGALEGNLFSKSKAQRKKAMKAAQKAAKENPGALLPKVPLEHQTVDLPAGDGTLQGSVHAGEVREELRSAMRTRRRKDIKERNYLQGMS